MAGVLFGPEWFFGEGIIIDIFSVFALALVTFFSLKYYRVRKSRSYLYLAISFGLLIASLVLKNLISTGIHYDIFGMGQFGFGMLGYYALKSANQLIFWAYSLYYLIALVGLYIFYSIYQKQSPYTIALVVYLLLISTYFSYPYVTIFFLSSFVILLLITVQCTQRYISKKYPATRLLVVSLGLLTLSQVCFMLMGIDAAFYIVAEFVQLAGYTLLLITLIAVLIHGRKKDENRYYW
ncbi:TPA: hypothetical protein HA372_02120 [Candidatus Woesearchaeota archaeon]|nr:hypothetical protein [Candidatus Woesearchaeota archaeon]HII65400.1 hypothetical protein [Candidatus Woesearchaeota archaeon]HIJ18464.1 hypothetical protein [Candidatus Woesearchaeota archaeon]